MGKILDFTTDNCDGASSVKPFWAPDFEVHLDYEIESVTKSTKIAKVLPDGVVEWDPQGLKLIQFRSAPEANAGLAKFKRK